MLVFLFTDIEGSSRLWEEHTGEMGAVIARHDALLQQQVHASGGRITKHTGDGITAAFEGGEPVGCALETQMRFGREDWGAIGELRIRVGLHAGAAEWIAGAERQGGDYFGPPVNCTARIQSAAWGGQILLTPEVTRASPLPARASLKDLGEHLLKDVSGRQQIYQLVHPDLPWQAFPPPRTLSGESIRRAMDEQGSYIASLAPPAIAVALVGATLAPMLHGDLSPDSPALSGNLGVLDDLGTVALRGFTADFASRLQARQEAGQATAMSEVRHVLEGELLERLGGSDETALALRADASRLLQTVHGVEAAMTAAADDVKAALAQGLADLGLQFGEFRWMLAGVQDTLSEIGALQRQHLAMTEEILRLQREKTRVVSAPAPALLAAEPPAFLEGDEEPFEQPVFVAREREQAWLNGALDAALEGQGRVVLVTGGPGRGKTALLDAFARQAMDEHDELLVASGTCNAYSGMGDPYLPFREVLGMLSGEVEAHWAAGVISRDHALRLWQALPAAVEALLAHGPHVSPALVPGEALVDRACAACPTEPWLVRLRERVERRPAAAEGLEQSHLFQQVSNVLHALSQVHPLLLILDDLQWVDRASAGLLFHVGRRLEGARILITGAYRPEEMTPDPEARGRGEGELYKTVPERHPLEKVLAEFRRLYGDVWLDLAEVEAPEGRRFVDALLETEPNRLGEGFRQTLTERAQDHPLFTVELLRAMQERGDLVQDEAGRWVEGPALDWDLLPARVQGVIGERIERLGEELRQILTVASVEGEDFTAEVVAQVQSLEARALVRRLSGELQREHRLVRARGLRRLGARRLALYRFQHHLFQKYLYNHLDQAERAYLHEDVGTVLEALYGGQTDEVAVQLARHFLEAGVTDKAAHYLGRAGELAAARYANEEAVAHLSQALELAPDMDRAERYRLLLRRNQIYSLLGRVVEQRRDVAELEALAEGLGAEQQAEAAYWRARFAHATSDYPGAVTAGRMVVDRARAVGHTYLQAQGHLRWGFALHLLCDYAAAQTQFEAALSLAQTFGLRDVEADALSRLATGRWLQGDWATGRDYYEHSLRVYQQTSDRAGELQTLATFALLSCDLGDFVGAWERLDRCLAAWREMGDCWGDGMYHFDLGLISCAVGNYVAARGYFERALQIGREIEGRMLQWYSLGGLAQTTLYLGDYAEAREYTEKALSIAREVGAVGDVSRMLNILGELHRAQGRLDVANDCFEEALRLARQIGNPRRVAPSLAGLADAALAQGDLSRAQAHAAEILTRLQAGLALPFWGRPFWIRLTCCRVLKAAGDPCAADFLQQTYDLLMEYADRIADETMRRSFLENVPWHREIVELATELDVQG